MGHLDQGRPSRGARVSADDLGGYREAARLVHGWATEGRAAAATDLAAHHRRLHGLPDPPPRPPHVLAVWPNFDFERPSYDRPPCDKCGSVHTYQRYGARRADEQIADGHLGWRTVPLCRACCEEMGSGLISWLIERTGG